MKKIIASLLISLALHAGAAGFGVTNGIVTWYLLGTNTGSTLPDWSGNGVTGTLEGSPQWTTNGLVFNGTNDIAFVPTGTFNPFTVSIWWQGATNVTQNIFAVSTSKGSLYNGVLIGNERGDIFTPGLQTTADGTTAGAVESTGFNNTVFECDGNSQVSIYLNGTLLATHSFPSGAGNVISQAGGWFGLSGYGGPNFSGTLNDLRIYNRALSSTEVSSNFAAGYSLAPYVPPPHIPVTNNAASGNIGDVQTAINLCQPGDTVAIPAGSWTWSTNTVVAYVIGITLQGAGPGQTIIHDALTSSSVYDVSMIPQTTALTRLTGITFDFQGATANYLGKIVVDGRTYNSAASWRIDNCVFTNTISTVVRAYGFGTSVIDHNKFYSPPGQVSLCVQHYGEDSSSDSTGNDSWAQPSAYGTNYVGYIPLYVEANEFHGQAASSDIAAASDAEAGARIVERFNLVDNMNVTWHGTDTSLQERGLRSFEIYGNTFTNMSNSGAVNIRSGTGLIYSNTVSSSFGFNNTWCFMFVEQNGVYGLHDGYNPWDSNNPTTFYTGTVSSYASVANYLTVTVPGVNWTPNQWAGYTLNDTTYSNYLKGAELSGTNVNNGVGGTVSPYTMPWAGLIYQSGSNTLTLTPYKDYPLLATNGDSFVIRQVVAGFDQLARGSGDQLGYVYVGTYPTGTPYYWNETVNGTNYASAPVYPHQPIEPIYSKANTVNGTPVEVSPGAYPNFVIGRDIMTNALPSNYAPLAYPHPLDAGAIGATNVPPGITIQPVSQTVASNSTASFSVTATGTAPLGYQWFYYSAISGATNATYTTGNLTSPGSLPVSVVISNAFGVVTSSVVSLTVTNVGSGGSTNTIGTNVIKISQLPAAQYLTGVELVPVVQGGVTRYTTINGVAAKANSTLLSSGNPALLSSLVATNLTYGLSSNTVAAYASNIFVPMNGPSLLYYTTGTSAQTTISITLQNISPGETTMFVFHNATAATTISLISPAGIANAASGSSTLTVAPGKTFWCQFTAIGTTSLNVIGQANIGL